MNEISEESLKALAAFKNCFVEQTLVTQIFADFDRLRFNHRLGGGQQCMLVTGDTGVGKTELTKYYLQRVPQDKHGGYAHRPVLLSRIPSKATLESTIIELHKDLGQPFSTIRRGKSNDQSLTESLIRLLNRCGTELIIIDEFHELLEFQAGSVRADIANRLKFISEQAAIPIVLVGMPWAAKIAEEPQWGSRLINRRFIPYFKLSEDYMCFTRFLKGLAMRMPFETPPKLEKRHTTYALFSASRGCLRTLKELLYEAVALALRLRAQTLRNEHLAQSFGMLSQEKLNPFELPVDEIQACEVEAYSRYEFSAPKDANPIIDTKFAAQLPISQLLSMSTSLRKPHRS
ncbi:TniB family NTP-binding protein [Ferrimonas sp.]|uniref:TniB family NTP-binding protein n=1 Tax=Ferrimonas sp. TaxID=2080861 RepID=UPI003A928A56